MILLSFPKTPQKPFLICTKKRRKQPLVVLHFCVCFSTNQWKIFLYILNYKKDFLFLSFFSLLVCFRQGERKQKKNKILENKKTKDFHVHMSNMFNNHGNFVISCFFSFLVHEREKKTLKKRRKTTLNNGYLGSRNDEERSEMRYVMWIAGLSESSNLWTHIALVAALKPIRAHSFEGLFPITTNLLFLFFFLLLHPHLLRRRGGGYERIENSGFVKRFSFSLFRGGNRMDVFFFYTKENEQHCVSFCCPSRGDFMKKIWRCLK